MNHDQSQLERVATAPGGALHVLPRVNITVRAGTPADVPFMDALQRKTTRQVGWMPTKQFEGKVAAGHVLVADVVGGGQWAVGREEGASSPSLTTNHCPLTTVPAGYLIGHDQYFKRDDVGVIYQINVVPAMRRSLVAASLLKAQFERSAYGCKLYCCWCAQDIEANRFWEAMGFVPLAFRAGSEKKSRVHIFWQKRIRRGDDVTPWWFPSQTSGGSIREDRLVLPIPPGVSWRDEMPRVLPKAACGGPGSDHRFEALEAAAGPAPTAKRRSSGPKPTPGDPQPAKKAPLVLCGGMRFAAPAPPPEAVAPAKPQKTPPRPKEKRKNDPQLIAAARELRDRWLDEVNTGRFLPATNGKYDVCRSLADGTTPPGVPALLLPLPPPLAA
ncbi:MAG TPA: hypothetical protein VK324_17725 [Tepidisphaeraceae bacterium]|nr:hypothetical protein [Tepidisphaeraceae bacterium]